MFNLFSLATSQQMIKFWRYICYLISTQTHSSTSVCIIVGSTCYFCFCVDVRQSNGSNAKYSLHTKFISIQQKTVVTIGHIVVTYIVTRHALLVCLMLIFRAKCANYYLWSGEMKVPWEGKVWPNWQNRLSIT